MQVVQHKVDTRLIQNQKLLKVTLGYSVENLFCCVRKRNLLVIYQVALSRMSIEKALKQKEVLVERSPRKYSSVCCALLVAVQQYL